MLEPNIISQRHTQTNVMWRSSMFLCSLQTLDLILWSVLCCPSIMYVFDLDICRMNGTDAVHGSALLCTTSFCKADEHFPWQMGTNEENYFMRSDLTTSGHFEIVINGSIKWLAFSDDIMDVVVLWMRYLQLVVFYVHSYWWHNCSILLQLPHSAPPWLLYFEIR